MPFCTQFRQTGKMVLCVFNAFLSYQAAQVQCNNSTYQVGPHLMSRKQVQCARHLQYNKDFFLHGISCEKRKKTIFNKYNFKTFFTRPSLTQEKGYNSLKTLKADCCVVVVGLLANPTSVSLYTVKQQISKFVKLFNYTNPSSISGQM